MRNLKIKLGIGKMWVRPVANLAQPTPLRWGRGMGGGVSIRRYYLGNTEHPCSD